MTIKFCSMCKTEKSIDLFGPNKSKKDNLQSYCRDCYKIIDKNKRLDYKQKEYDINGLEKLCQDCQTIKPLSDFSKDKGRANHCSAYCKPCGYKRKRKRYFERVYNISLIEINNIIILQGNKCSICKINFDVLPRKQIHVDHNHVTGTMREIICQNCNTIIGHAKESTEILNNVIKYLNKHNDNCS